MSIATDHRSRSPLARQGDGLEDGAKLLLRLSLAVLMLLHGVSKISGGIEPILGMVARAGLPAPLGYLVFVGEVAAPLLLIVGVWTRAAAVVVAINMIVAVALAHTAQLATLSPNGGWALELQGLYLVVALAIALLGAGRYSAGSADGPWN